MPKKQKKLLTDLELLLMSIVWEKEKATVRQVRDSLPKNRPLEYTSVLATMRNLECKGYLRHEVVGLTYVYYPAVMWNEVVESLLRYPAERLFKGSAELLMVSFLEKQKLNPEKLKELRKLIAAKEKKVEK